MASGYFFHLSVFLKFKHISFFSSYFFWRYLTMELIWHLSQSPIRPSIYFSLIVKSRSNLFLESVLSNKGNGSSSRKQRGPFMGLQNGNRQMNTALFDLILLRSEHSLFPNICFLNFEISNTHNRHFINHVPIVYHFPPTHRNIWQCLPPKKWWWLI